ncbi:hypothetical protein WH47_04584, partial [Habropoda laboriosa]
ITTAINFLFYLTGGCSAFGHSCYGGHGKRFDPHLRDNVLQGNEPSTDDRSEKTETLSLSNDFVRPEQKFGGQPEILFPQMRRQDSSRFDPYTLSFIVRQWVYKFSLNTRLAKKLFATYGVFLHTKSFLLKHFFHWFSP